MATPDLTIGMAVYEDYDGVAFTLQSLRLSNDLSNVELIVIDNSPDTAHGKESEKIAKSCGAIYIPMPENTGTTQPRNRIFQEARGNAVMCMDSHVMLRPNTVNRLIDWYKANPDNCDIISGPLLHDNLLDLSTQFDPVWSGGMWGRWGTDPRANDENAPPFEIWGQGLGLFTTRRAAWLGFNEDFRAFGGEEGYIHEKYRQAGHKAICIPWLRWWHRFGRPGGVKYPISNWNKVRNYVLGYKELGLALEPIHEHFVATSLISESEWQELIADPTPKVRPMPGPKQDNPEPVLNTVSGIYNHTRAESVYMGKHLDYLCNLAGQCDTVEEVSRYYETTIALFAGKPKALRSHLYGNNYANPLFATLDTLLQGSGTDEFSRETANGQWAEWNVRDCDMLVYKTPDQHPTLYEDLKKWTPFVKRWFVVFDALYNPQLAVAMRDFLDEHPEWFVYSHTPLQFGMTVLGRRPEDRPEVALQTWLPRQGPGQQLKALLKSVGLPSPAPEAFRDIANQMDGWGPDGCDVPAQRAAIVAVVSKSHDQLGLQDKLVVAAKMAALGCFSKESLVMEAVRRARQ